MNNIIHLDYHSRTPIYEQIVKQFERYVALGLLKPNEQILSIRELAAVLGINPNTVKKAYENLEQKKVIYAVSTKGYFISDNTNELIQRKVNEKIDKIKDIIIELEKLGVSKEQVIDKLSK